MKIQVIITSINLWDKYTKACIESTVKACEGLDYRILLIDNGSTDNTKEEAGKLVSERFAHHRNEEAWCCSKSWNYGVQDAFSRGFDYVLILNNDVLLHPESIKQLLERFEKSKSMSAAVYDPINSIDLAAALFTDSLRSDMLIPTKIVPESEVLAMATMMDITGECETPEAIFTKDLHEKDSCPESEHPCFSGFMINRTGYEKVGPFDEMFQPCYFEDNDYHHRINSAGMKAIVLPTSLFYHYGSRTQIEALGGIPICPPVAFERNRQYFCEKWGGMPGHEIFKRPFNK